MAAFAASPMRCGGCGAKVGATVLSRVLKTIRERAGEEVDVDMDDCAVVEGPPGGCMMVHTVDFFRSFLSDPFVFGRVSAIHALSDCHAMLAQPSTALALAVAPYAASENITMDTLVQMLSGASDALKEDGCKLVGGHTCEGAELSLGFAVNGFVKKEKVKRKRGGNIGDKIVLTKPIGTGALFAAEMRGKCSGLDRAEGIKWMCTSNGMASREVMDESNGWKINACTDVTGFGVAGHLIEMLDYDAGVGAKIFLNEVPFLNGAIAAAKLEVFSSLQKSNSNNRRGVKNHAVVAKVDAIKYPLLFDPQTSGGLLFMIEKDQAEDFVKKMKKIGYEDSAVIGELVVIEKKASDLVAKVDGEEGFGEVCSLAGKPVLEIVGWE